MSVVLALLLGIWFYGTASALLQPYLSSRSVANFAGFFIVFCACGAAGEPGEFRDRKVSARDRALVLSITLLGAGFGLLRGTLIAVALISGHHGIHVRESSRPPSVVHSRMAPYVVDAARVVAAVAPHELKEGFRRTYGQVKSAWGKALEQGIHGLPAGKASNERKI